MVPVNPLSVPYLDEVAPNIVPVQSTFFKFIKPKRSKPVAEADKNSVEISKERASLPPTKFQLGAIVKVQGEHWSTEGQIIEHNGPVKISGQEWGCFWQGEHIRARNKDEGWLYLVVDTQDRQPITNGNGMPTLPAQKRFYVSEEDLLKWNG